MYDRTKLHDTTHTLKFKQLPTYASTAEPRANAESNGACKISRIASMHPACKQNTNVIVFCATPRWRDQENMCDGMVGVKVGIINQYRRTRSVPTKSTAFNTINLKLIINGKCIDTLLFGCDSLSSMKTDPCTVRKRYR